MYFFQNMYLARSLSEAFALFDAHPAARWIAGGTCRSNYATAISPRQS